MKNDLGESYKRMLDQMEASLDADLLKHAGQSEAILQINAARRIELTALRFFYTEIVASDKDVKELSGLVAITMGNALGAILACIQPAMRKEGAEFLLNAVEAGIEAGLNGTAELEQRVESGELKIDEAGYYGSSQVTVSVPARRPKKDET